MHVNITIKKFKTKKYIIITKVKELNGEMMEMYTKTKKTDIKLKQMNTTSKEKVKKLIAKSMEIN